jgi:DNA-binding response OmpR family regulator
MPGSVDEAFPGHTDGLSAEKKGMRVLPEREPPSDPGGSRVGMLGFPSQLSDELGGALTGAQCLVSNLPDTGDDQSDPLEGYDIVIVWAGEDGPDSRVEELVATSQRWLLFGPEERIRQNSSLYLRADDVVFTPYSLNELLFRIHRTMHRTKVRSQPFPKRYKPTILVADDDPAMLALLGTVLRNSDWECQFVADGRQALAGARKLAPDLLVMDIEMPFMTGLEVLRRIRRDTETRGMKVLLLTASNELKHVEEGLSLGADDYLAKPFSHLALVHRVRKLLFSASTVWPAV